MGRKANRIEIAAATFYWTGITMLFIGIFINTNKSWVAVEIGLFLISTILYRWVVELRKA